MLQPFDGLHYDHEPTCVCSAWLRLVSSLWP